VNNARILDYLIMKEGWEIVRAALDLEDVPVLLGMIDREREGRGQSRRKKTAKERIRRRLRPHHELIRDMARRSCVDSEFHVHNKGRPS
jgi:hypothetical protein